MNEQNIRSLADLRTALTMESIMAEARKVAANMPRKAKRLYMRACRKVVADAQSKSKDCG